MRTRGAHISRPRKTTATMLPYQYQTARFMRGPCTCKYDYAGTAKHMQSQYGFAADQGPSVLSEIEQYLCNTFNLSLQQVPDSWVLNLYTADTFIDWHTDEDNLFGALDRETKIISLSSCADGVLCMKHRTGQHLASSLGLAGKTRGLSQRA